MTTSNGKQAVEITSPQGSKVVYTEDNTHPFTSDSNQNAGPSGIMEDYYNPNGSQTNLSSMGSSIDSSNSSANPSSDAYYNSLPKGIPRCQIPPGQEDLYILKSEVVPPVCPACPPPIVQCPDKTDVNKCPPCPPCARCPEPAFECKKVPNYSAFNPNYMPVPVLSDFSSFGM